MKVRALLVLAFVVAAGFAYAGGTAGDYTPPQLLNGHGKGSAEDGLFTDDSDDTGHGKPLENQMNLKDFDLPSGLDNVRVFPGTTAAVKYQYMNDENLITSDPSKYLFNRSVLAALAAQGVTNMDEIKKGNLPNKKNVNIYGLTTDPPLPQKPVNDLVCTVRFDLVDNTVNDWNWNPKVKGLLAINYNVNSATHLAWIEFVFRRPQSNASGYPGKDIQHPEPADYTSKFWHGVHSHRIIFLDRSQDASKYYNYDTPTPDKYAYPTTTDPKTMEQRPSHRLICDVMPYQGYGPVEPPTPPKPPQQGAFQAGGGGGEM